MPDRAAAWLCTTCDAIRRAQPCDACESCGSREWLVIRWTHRDGTLRATTRIQTVEPEEPDTIDVPFEWVR